MTGISGAAEAGLLTLDDVARITGLAPGSVRAYHNQANRARREGVATETDMPAPDLIVVRTPTWRPETIESWMQVRETRRREAELAGEKWAQKPATTKGTK
jgi:hypothetical protein